MTELADVPSFKTVRHVPFTADEMFALVADVETYPQFVPLCESLVVRSREGEPPGSLIVATMGIGYKAIRESFTTRVELDSAGRKILVTHVDGPFRKLENRWGFRPRADGASCDVDFAIDYEFRSPILAVLMGAVFDTAFRKFSDAFEERAGVVYGRRRPVAGPVSG